MSAVRSDITVNVGLIAAVVSIESAVSAPKSDPTVCLGQPNGEGGFHEHAPIPRQRPYVCPECGPITDQARTAKARKIGNEYHLVDIEAVAGLSAEASKPFLDPTFVPSPREQVDRLTVSGEKRYYLTMPAGHASVPENYAALREMVRQNPEFAFTGMFTPRSAAGLFTLEVQDDTLVLCERVLLSGLKEIPAIDATPGQFAELAVSLVPQWAVDFTESTYDADYAQQVADLYAGSERTVQAVAKAQGKTAPVAIASGNDLMAQLQSMLVEPRPKRAPRKTAAAKREKVAA